MKIIKNFFTPQYFSQSVFIASVAGFIGLALSLGFILFVNASVTESSLINSTTNSSKITNVTPKTIGSFKLNPTAGETLNAVKFTVNKLTATTSDFLAIYFVKVNDSTGIRTTLSTITTSTLVFDSEMTFSMAPDAIDSGYTYQIVVQLAPTAVEGHQFSMSLNSGTDTYILSSGTINATGLTTQIMTIDLTPPTRTPSGGLPPNGTNMPINAFVDIPFTENIATTTVTTSSVSLKANTGNTQGGTPTGDNLCLSVGLLNGNVVKCEHMSDNQPLAISTWYTVTVTVSTTDIAGNPLASEVTSTFQTGSFDAGNNTTPPFVQSSVPQPGTFDFPINGNLFVTFPSGDQGNMAIVGVGSVTSTANVELKLAVNGQPSGTNLCLNGGCVLTWSSSDHTLKIDPASNLTANTDYMLVVKKEMTNFVGVPLQGGMQDVMRFFHTSSGGADLSAPTITGTNPIHNSTGIQLNLSAMVIHFSKEMDQSTLVSSTVEFFVDTNANGVKDGDESPLITSYQYDAMQKVLFIGQQQILSANTKYCVRFVDSNVTDSLGNALSTGADVYKCFTTTAQAYVATAPTIQLIDADNFMAWVQYDQPIDPTEAVNKANYTLECGSSQLNTSGMTFTHRPEANAVEIQGHGCTKDSVLTVTVTGIKDLNGGITIIANGTSNVGKVTVLDSTNTGGFIGGFDKPDFNNKDFGNFWENPERCAPNTTIKSKTSRWMCEFSVPVALTSGAKLILTIPSGFSIFNAALISSSNSFLNADLNGPGPGITTISAIATSSAANTITLTIAHSGDAMSASDHLRFEFEGVANSAVEGSNSVSIIVKDATGIKQGQTINTAPFTIGAGGARSLSGTVCKGSSSGGVCGEGDTGVSGVKVFIDSPQSGHQEATTDGSGDYSFTSLSDGQYNVGIFIDPGLGESLGGGNNFQSVNVSGANATNIDFKKSDVSSSGKTLTVSITGGPANTELDIFCFAPNSNGFSAPIMKNLTTNGSGAISGTLKLQPNTDYQCGVGPHIPFDTFSSGGPPSVPDFTFMPPAPKMINVAEADLATTFVLIQTTNQIKGKVTDGSGTAIANVFVDARPIGCFDSDTGALKDCNGGFSKTKSDGTFTLSVTEGTYILSACAPGMPCSNEVEVTVKADTGNVGVDNNSTANVYAKGTLLTGVGQIIKMAKSDLTIAGQVQDENGTAIQYAFVNAQRGTGSTCSSFTPNGGNAGSPTDAQGNYTLYVSAGTWRVEAFAGMYGQVNCSIITVSDSSLTGQNIKATTADYGTISGTVTKNGSAVQGANVNCFGSSGGNQTISGNDGSYSIKVKAGSGYSCDGFVPGAGQLTRVSNITVISGQTETVDLSMGNPGTISINLGNTITNAFCDARNSTGFGNGTNQNTSGVYKIAVPAGTYTVRCGNPSIGEVGVTSTIVIAGETNNITFSAPSLFTITGRITDGSSNLEGASITLTDKTNGRIVFKESDATSGSNANVSVSIPAGTYSVIASKSGYVDTASPETLTVSATGSFTTRSLTKAGATASITVQTSGANYTGNAKVVATNSDGKVVTADVDKTVSSGANASLALTNGTWTVRAFGDNGKTVASASTIVVSSNTPDSSPTLALDTAITGFTVSQSKQQPMIPSNGGLFKDTNIDSNFELSIPTGALSTSDSTAGTIETKENPTLAIDTLGKEFVGTSAIDITPKNSSGQKISDITSAATIKIPYDPTDIPSGVAESALQCGTWNEAAGEWETLPTSVDTVNNILTCQTTHFSTFGVVAATSGGTTSAPAQSPASSSNGGSSSFAPTLPVKPVAIQSIQAQAAYEINKSTALVLGEVTHTVTVLSIDASSTTLVIQSSPVTTTLALNQSKNIDTNADSFDDLTVTFTGVDANGKVQLTIVTIADEKETTGPLSINAGQYETSSTTVSVFLKATNATHVMLSNVSSFLGATYVPFSSKISWVLTSGNGEKRVYARFKSASNDTVEVFDTIKLVAQGFEQKSTAKEVSDKSITCSLEIGSPYKAPNSSAVYYITKPFGGGSTCVKRPFSKVDTFFTYFSSWSDVKKVSQSSLNAINEDTLGFMPLGPKYNPQYGSLIKSVNSPEVYLLVNNKKRWIDTEETFKSFGYSWNWIEDVDEGLIQGLSEGDIITKQTGYPSGLLIKYVGDAKVYLLEPHKTQTNKLIKRHIKNMKSFNALGYRWDRIVTVPSSIIFEDGEQLTNEENTKFTFTLDLSPGTTSEEVRQLQLKLQNLGFLSKDVVVTGHYGFATTEAVKNFQTAKGIQALGFVGPNTRSVLNSL